MPGRQVGKLIGAHQPDQLRRWPNFSTQLFQGLDCKGRADSACLAVINRYLPGLVGPGRHVQHSGPEHLQTVDGRGGDCGLLPGLATRNQANHIQLECEGGRSNQDPMADMGRVEGATEKTDARMGQTQFLGTK
jgi:hypothetical protein